MNAPGPRLPLAVRVRPRYSGWSSLATRILVVNLLALMVLAGGILYLENFRARMLETRAQELMAQAEIMAGLLEDLPAEERRTAIAAFESARGTRARLYDPSGALVADNWASADTSRFQLEDPTTEGFRRDSAMAIDRAIDALTGEPELPPYPRSDPPDRSGWLEAEAAAARRRPVSAARMTNERLIVLQVAVPVAATAERDADAAPPPVLLLTVDTPDVIDQVRRERATSFLVFLAVLGFSLALSLYLARTIVVPLRQLALAAHRVRLGRARDVVVPRLPHRRDEIGGLARALADMTATLRQRIDATETFAADVAHELKNPLASLRSAVEALGTVRNAEGRRQLFQLIEDDVRRIDRLITDISAASRIDAELSRTRLEPVDLAGLAGGILAARTAAGALPRGVNITSRLAPEGEAMVAADPDRMAQVINNLLDNAISFSPEGGTVFVALAVEKAQVQLIIEDEGPGVQPDARDAIFQRFYTERPAAELYGIHSGLGLSIARAIVEAMDGRIAVTDRADGKPGARFVVCLPRL